MKTQNTTHDHLIPTLILKNAVLMPSVTIPILVTKPGAINAIQRAIETDQMIYVTSLKPGRELDSAQSDDIYATGTLALVNKLETTDKGEKVVHLRAVERYSFIRMEFQEAFATWMSVGEPMPDQLDLDSQTELALLKNLKEISFDILKSINATPEFLAVLEEFKTVASFTNIVTQNLPLIISKKQEILEITSIKNRALKVLELLVEQREMIKVNSEMGLKISEKTSRAYRESILREQLKAIKEELGEDVEVEVGETGEKLTFKERILRAHLPKDVEKIALEQLSRFESMGAQNAESHIIKNYLELILALPWNEESKMDFDLDRAKKILDEEHFGLEKVKEHIIQHLAVMKLNPEKKGSILLLVGPPGVGKTSLGQSIAKSLNRKYVRASLGGVRDDSEIRGHRRTYLGSMPGRIIEGIKRAKEKNPVFVLDEIDKLTRGYGGDPASALLEVLDPEQNQNFLDHYLDVPFDLSKVFFIATANSLESIPGPLLDRMEVINLGGYTLDEKIHISLNHLLPKQLKEHGIDSSRIEFKEEMMKHVISDYTREAGVRDLQRKISKILRGLAEKFVHLKNSTEVISVNMEMIEKILGVHKISFELAEKDASPGVVTGLAWTPVGGDILFIESLMMPGSGKIQLTGKLGEVMSESAHIGLSLVRSKLSSLVPGFDFSKTDFHIHVPSGSIPKDGPSAGITIFTALCSLVLGKPVDSHLAMTGEITLRGAVMPVGGVKEKLIAAQRAGITKIIMSKKNERDLIDVPEKVKRALEFHFVENISELLNAVFGQLNLDYKDPKIYLAAPHDEQLRPHA